MLRVKFEGICLAELENDPFTLSDSKGYEMVRVVQLTVTATLNM